MPKSYIVDDDYNDSRLDKWFKSKIINVPHSLLEKILRQNKVKINKKKARSSYRLQVGDLIEIYDISKLLSIVFINIGIFFIALQSEIKHINNSSSLIYPILLWLTAVLISFVTVTSL